MPITEYGPPISLGDAKRILEAAEAEAAARGWAMVIAVVDSGGHMVALHRMDRAQFGSIDVARAKAETAVAFRRPSKAFEEAVAGGGAGLKMLVLPGVCPLEGGLPLVREGRIVGAIGVSGARSDEDGVVAEAGSRALGG